MSLKCPCVLANAYPTVANVAVSAETIPTKGMLRKATGVIIQSTMLKTSKSLLALLAFAFIITTLK